MDGRMQKLEEFNSSINVSIGELLEKVDIVHTWYNHAKNS
jgi:hypothetical protein